MGLFSDFFKGKQPNILDNYLLRLISNSALYPEQNHVKSYSENNDVFSVINKITEPASVLPIFQYDKDGNIRDNGKMLARVNEPNPYQSKSLFIESALTYYLLFGESFTAAQLMDGQLTKGPLRIDSLPPQWMILQIGTNFNPIAGWTFAGAAERILYNPEEIYHFKEFNPNYDNGTGGHLRGMSRLKPLIKSVTGTQAGYDAMVKALQNQGAWGMLAILDNEGKTKDLNKVQKSELKAAFKRDSKKGDLTVSSNAASWTKIGLTMVELEVIKSLGTFKGNLYDAYNTPSQLFSGSQDRTYNNYKEAEKALWTNAICPTVDSYLEGLSKFLAPKFGEEGDVLKADYSGVEALQRDISAMVTWMVSSKSFTKNEIREASGFERLEIEGMDTIFDSFGLVPVDQIGNPPDSNVSNSVLKALKISDYRE